MTNKTRDIRTGSLHEHTQYQLLWQVARRERDAQFKARFESDKKGLAELVRYEASLQGDPVAR